MRRILLVEPKYKNKYPPLGLMKISTYHKQKGDEVTFVKGCNKELKNKKWDRIYITTLFTFYWNITVDTIKFYFSSVENPYSIYLGGVSASIITEEFKNELDFKNITILTGLLDKPGVLDKNDQLIIDHLTPDYSIIDVTTNIYLNYSYPVDNCFIAYATRGCVRKCAFCAVPILEPIYCSRISIKEQINEVKEKYGDRRNLMLLDNNVLASSDLELIVDELLELGYERGNKNHTKVKDGKTRKQVKYIDFNQGTDARLLTEKKMMLLSKLEIRPLRIAFDTYAPSEVEIYKRAMRLAARYGVKTLSNYMLFNFEDEPLDLYKRIRVNIDLNEEFTVKGYGTSIWSFPMRYSPIKGEFCKDRKFLGEKWTKKDLRGIQCILNATHGVVGAKKKFFEHAFGKNEEEFLEIILMPERFIIQRKENEQNGSVKKWKNLLALLSIDEKIEFKRKIDDNIFTFEEYEKIDSKYKVLFSMYISRKRDLEKIKDLAHAIGKF